MKILLRIPERKYAQVCNRLNAVRFAAKHPKLQVEEVRDGFKWVSFESPYLTDLVRVAIVLPEGCAVWETADGAPNDVYLKPVRCA